MAREPTGIAPTTFFCSRMRSKVMSSKNLVQINANVSMKGMVRSIRDLVVSSPERKIKNADAKRHAQLTEAQTAIDVKDIHSGIKEYRQGNLHAITGKAHDLLPNVESAQWDGIDPSWASTWLDKAQHAFDEEIQYMWAKILAGEAESPGAFSKFALETVGNMDKADIDAFNKFSTFCWDIGAVVWEGSVYQPNRSLHLRLERSGLVSFSGLGVKQHFVKSFFGNLTYHDERFMLCASANSFDGCLPVGMARLTTTGEELLPLCRSLPDARYRDDCLGRWRKEGFDVVSEIIRGSQKGDSILAEMNNLSDKPLQDMMRKHIKKLTRAEYERLVTRHSIRDDVVYFVLKE